MGSSWGSPAADSLFRAKLIRRLAGCPALSIRRKAETKGFSLGTLCTISELLAASCTVTGLDAFAEEAIADCSPSAQVGQIGVIEEERVVGSS